MITPQKTDARAVPQSAEQSRKRSHSAKQLSFRYRTHGGARKGAGRKRRPENVGLQAHGRRPAFVARVPVHITMRVVRRIPNLRTDWPTHIIVRELQRASAKGFRIVHFSIQTNHLHLIAEADDGQCLSRGVQRFASRVAMALNALIHGRGSVWRERYHRRDLSSPSQFRNALVYVLFNVRKHATGAELELQLRVLDGHSSAYCIDDWDLPPGHPLFERVRAARAGPPLVTRARSWIASSGWQHIAPLHPAELPRRPS